MRTALALFIASSCWAQVGGTLGGSSGSSPATGSCTLPNVVTGVNAGSAPTCAQPSNVTGNAATVTTNANLTGPVTSVGNATTIAYFGTAPTISTFSASGNISLDVGAGFGAGVSGSTMVPNGMLYFASSNTVTGSTTTQSNVQTFFSTYTLPGNALFNLGDALVIDCMFRNNASGPGTVIESVTNGVAGATTLARGGYSAADSFLLLRVTMTLLQVGGVDNVTYETGCVSTGGCTMQVSQEASTKIRAFDATAAQVFNCSASRQTGGNIDFVWMKVSKQ